jgi:hypothetical protein
MEEVVNNPAPAINEQTPPEPEIQLEPKKKKSKLLWVILAVILILLIAGGILLFVLSKKEGGIVESIRSFFGRDSEVQEEESEELSVSEVDETDDDSDIGEEIIYEYFDCSDMWMADGWNSYTNDHWNYSLKHTKDIFVEEFENVLPKDRTEFTVGYEPQIFLIFETFIKQTEAIDTQLATILTNTCTENITYTNVQYGDNTYRKAIASEDESCLAGLGIETEKDRVAFAHATEEGIYFILKNDNYNLEQETELMCSIVFN